VTRANQPERRERTLADLHHECKSCSATLDRRQSFSDDPLTVHDECGGSLRRVIYPAGIVFKGSGFYNTDYKNSTASNKGAESTESKTDTATSESKSDTAASTNGSASSSDASSAKTESKSESKPATPAPTTP
jgi:putative FmdB family regulatory protein